MSQSPYNLKEELSAEMQQAYLSTLVFAKMFFPKRFSRPFSSIHRQICKHLDGPDQKIALAAPRGIGKTSLVALAYTAKKVLFRESRFIIFVTNSADAAVEQTENLKEYLISTPLIQDLFGDLKSARWAKDRWMIRWEDGTTTMILPRGAGQQIRGSLHRDDRPDLIVVDDLENDELVESEVQRAKLRKWFYNSLLKCVDLGEDDWKIVVIDTIKHEDCLIERLQEHSGWTSERFSLCDENLHSLWSEFIDDAGVLKLYNEAKENDDLDGFYREHMNMPIATEEAGFPRSFRYFQAPFTELNRRLDNFVIVDPAKTANPKSAKTAILGGGVDTKEELVYFRTLINEKLHADEIVDHALNMCEQINSNVLAVEVTSLKEFITFPIRNEIARRGINVELVELSPRMKKEDRAKGLIPLYRRGQVLHAPVGMAALEAQLLSFPRPRYWDALDCAAYVVELFDIGARYFGRHSDNDASADDIEAEYRDLESDRMEDIDIEAISCPSVISMGI